MQIYKELVNFSVLPEGQKCVFTFGTFDGVHVGHRSIFEQVKTYAKAKNAQSAVLTFSNHPREVLSPENIPQMISSSKEKLKLVEECGFDVVVELLFSKQLAALSAEEFFQQVYRMLPFEVCLVGEDVSFGRGRAGGRVFLEQKAKELGFELVIVPKVCLGGEVVSSSAIRKAIYEGAFSQAAQFLARPYMQEFFLPQRASDGVIVSSVHSATPKEGRYLAHLQVSSLDEGKGFEYLSSRGESMGARYVSQKPFEVCVLGQGKVKIVVEITDVSLFERLLASKKLLLEYIQK